MNALVQLALKQANVNEAGKYHVFEGAIYSSSWATPNFAKTVANQTIDGVVYDSEGRLVYSS